MSVIITEWKCEKCSKEFYKYISFGHPDKDFDFEWKCGECGHINIRHIHSLESFDVLPPFITEMLWKETTNG